jgi:hypothetical protein
MTTNLHPNFSPMLAAGGVEFFVFLLIMAASAIFNWLQKRGKETDWSEVEKPLSPEQEQSRGGTFDWEQELRRMMAIPAPQLAPPPVIREHRPTPPTPTPVPAPATKPEPASPPGMAVSRDFGQTKHYKAHCEHCGGHIEFPANLMGESVLCPHCYKQTVLHPFGETKLEQIMHRTELAVLQESASAYQRAEQLDQSVAERLGAIDRQPVQATHVEHLQKRSEEIQATVSMLRTPQSARQAILASVILAPPKALET